MLKLSDLLNLELYLTHSGCNNVGTIDKLNLYISTGTENQNLY